jgi:hypothetical protein
MKLHKLGQTAEASGMQQTLLMYHKYAYNLEKIIPKSQRQQCVEQYSFLAEKMAWKQEMSTYFTSTELFTI